MKTRMLFVALTASIFFASWGGALRQGIGWSDGS